MAQQWYSVRCVFADGRAADATTYEERTTLWRADSFDEAINRAEVEADLYAAESDWIYLGLAQAFHLFDEPIDGGEVFSLVRDIGLSPRDYLDRHFVTGTERTRS